MLMKRIIKGRLLYVKSIEEGNNKLVKRIIELMQEDGKNTWMRTTRKYFEETDLNFRKIKELSKTQLKNILDKWDTRKWRDELESKSSMRIYRHWKENIKEENEIYDNTPASVIFFRARANCLQINDRKRFTNESMICPLCGEGEENLIHFLLQCPETSEGRTSQVTEFQQPYIENLEELVGTLLFREENMEQKKLSIYEILKIRKAKLERLAATDRN